MEVSILSRGDQHSFPNSSLFHSRGDQHSFPSGSVFSAGVRALLASTAFARKSSHLRGICGWCFASARWRRDRFYVDFPRRSIFFPEEISIPSRAGQYYWLSSRVQLAVLPLKSSTDNSHQPFKRLCQLKSRKAKLRNHLGFVGEIVILKRGLPSRSPPATFGSGIPSPDGSAPLLGGDAPAENAHRSDRTAPGSVGPAPPT
jgi:hypothetical protein